MATPFRTPTEVYTTANENQDIRAIVLQSMSADATTEVALYDSLQAAGYTSTQAAIHANPNNTRKLITYNVVITGTAVEADIEAIILDYTNTLALGADVDASVMSDAILALATVTTVPTFELSLDADPTGETIDLVIGAAEIAYTVAASIAFTDAG